MFTSVHRAPEQESLEDYLSQAGFRDINLNLKEESRNIISQWLPGSGAEVRICSLFPPCFWNINNNNLQISPQDFVISAEITARK